VRAWSAGPHGHVSTKHTHIYISTGTNKTAPAVVERPTDNEVPESDDEEGNISSKNTLGSQKPSRKHQNKSASSSNSSRKSQNKPPPTAANTGDLGGKSTNTTAISLLTSPDKGTNIFFNT
jgi:hypothetical protein